MKCSQCKEKLAEYIEGNLSAKVDEDIKEHILTCQSCKASYDEELLEYEAFKAAFSTDKVYFESITPKVMNAIDKDKYSKGKKVVKRRYIGPIAAALFLCIAISPFALRLVDNEIGLKSASYDAAKANEESALIMEGEDKAKFSRQVESEEVHEDSLSETRTDQLDGEGIDTVKNEDNTVISPNASYVSIYSMVEVNSDTNIEFNTPYISTVDGIYEASILGRGPYGSEEGIGTIYVKNTLIGTAHEFKLKNIEKQQSPLSISWYDNKHLMVVQGLGFGTLVNGVDIVIINVETGEQMLIATASGTTRFRSIAREGNTLVVGITEYVDETLDESVDNLLRIENYQLGDVIEEFK